MTPQQILDNPLSAQFIPPPLEGACDASKCDLLAAEVSLPLVGDVALSSLRRVLLRPPFESSIRTILVDVSRLIAA